MAGKAKAMTPTRQKDATKALRKVIEFELLDQEDQAKIVEAQMSMRANIGHVRSHAQALGGKLMRPNRLLNFDEIESELLRAKKEVEQGLKNLRKARLAIAS